MSSCDVAVPLSSLSWGATLQLECILRSNMCYSKAQVASTATDRRSQREHDIVSAPGCGTSIIQVAFYCTSESEFYQLVTASGMVLELGAVTVSYCHRRSLPLLWSTVTVDSDSEPSTTAVVRAAE